MVFIEDLLEAELTAATTIVSGRLPDVLAALDSLAPSLFAQGDRNSARRYISYIALTADELTSLPARHPDRLPESDLVRSLLLRDAVEYLATAPSPDGIGFVSVIVDRLRGLSGGILQEYGQVRFDLDVMQFRRLQKLISEAERERENASPVRRLMEIFDVSSAELADVMNVSRQAIEKWLLAGPPADRLEKVATIASIADILSYRLRPGLPAFAARRPAEAYEGHTMLELLKADRHDWLLESVRDSFDYTRTA